MGYARDHADDFFDHLHELLICTNYEEVAKSLRTVLEDYYLFTIDDFDFDDWMAERGEF